MFKYIKFLLTAFCFLLLFSCKVKNDKKLAIDFSPDSSKIIVKNIEVAALYQLKTNLQNDSAYQQLVSVLQTPTDGDSTSMEMDWRGQLSLAKDELVFTPNMPFIKGKTYLVQTILNAQFASGEDIIKSNIGNRIRKQQKTLKR